MRQRRSMHLKRIRWILQIEKHWNSILHTENPHSGTGAVERAIQTIENLTVTNSKDNLSLTESVSVNRALKVRRFTIHTRSKLTTFELHHGKKPQTELTNLVNDGESYLPDWSELSALGGKTPKFPIYVSRDEEGDITNSLLMARTKTEEKGVVKQPKETRLMSIPLKL